MFTAAWFAIAKRWKQPMCPLMDGWISKIWSTHTMGYYSAFKRKEVLTQATTWIDLEDMVLNERSQSQKDKHSVIPLIWGPRGVKFLKTESRIVVAKGWGEGEVRSDHLMSTDFSSAKWKVFWRWMVVIVHSNASIFFFLRSLMKFYSISRIQTGSKFHKEIMQQCNYWLGWLYLRLFRVLRTIWIIGYPVFSILQLFATRGSISPN